MDTKEPLEPAQNGLEDPVVQSTVCQHLYAWESRDIAVCTKGCGHGCMLNPDFFEIKNGKIIPKSNQGTKPKGGVE